MISEVGVAAILLNHLTKGTKEGGKAIYRSNGSIAYVAICRSAWIVTKDPQDNTGHRRLWLPTKNNMAKDHGIGLAYTIEGKTLAIEDEISSQPVVVWQGACETSADEAVVTPEKEDGPLLANAVNWLSSRLANGSVPAKQVYADAEADGIVKRTLERLAKLKVRAGNGGIFGQPWAWSLAQ